MIRPNFSFELNTCSIFHIQEDETVTEKSTLTQKSIKKLHIYAY